MYKKILITTLATSMLLGACSTPDYNKEAVDDIENKEYNDHVQDGVVVGSFEGVVVEVTEDNTVKIRLPRENEEVPPGLSINAEGLVEVGFASLNIPEHETYRKALESYLLDKEVKVFLQDETAHNLLGQVLVKSEEKGKEVYTAVQEYLYHDGLIKFYPELSELGQKVKETEESCKAKAEDNNEESYTVKAIAGVIKCVKTELE